MGHLAIGDLLLLQHRKYFTDSDPIAGSPADNWLYPNAIRSQGANHDLGKAIIQRGSCPEQAKQEAFAARSLEREVDHSKRNDTTVVRSDTISKGAATPNPIVLNLATPG